MRKISTVPPRRLVLSGGGLRVVSYIGVLRVLEETQVLSKIREFCGVSAGALVATMLALGYSLPKLERFFLEYDFSQVRTVEPESMLTLLDRFGIDSGENLEKLIHKFLHHKGFEPSATFRDLATSGRCKGLRIWASDLQIFQLKEFSAETTPDISVALALRATSAIPGYFVPVKDPETGRLLVDGGVHDNYPIANLSPKEARESLGVAFVYKTIPQDCEEFGKFLALLVAGYYSPAYQTLLQTHKSRTIVLPCHEFSSFHFEATREEKESLIQIGTEATRAFFSSHTYQGRRHSVS
jgi:NTE family protein